MKPSFLMAAAMAAALNFLAAPGARALEVKKSLYTNSGPSGPSAPGPARSNPIPPAMQQQLVQTLSDESDSYLNQESEKKSSGQVYVDVAPKFNYLPTMKDGKWNVEARLAGTEYQAPKSGTGKGKPTGAKKSLVFNYRLDGSKWTEVEPPKWVDSESAAAAKK